MIHEQANNFNEENENMKWNKRFEKHTNLHK